MCRYILPPYSERKTRLVEQFLFQVQKNIQSAVANSAWLAEQTVCGCEQWFIARITPIFVPKFTQAFDNLRPRVTVLAGVCVPGELSRVYAGLVKPSPGTGS